MVYSVLQVLTPCVQSVPVQLERSERVKVVAEEIKTLKL